MLGGSVVGKGDLCVLDCDDAIIEFIPPTGVVEMQVETFFVPAQIPWAEVTYLGGVSYMLWSHGYVDTRTDLLDQLCPLFLADPKKINKGAGLRVFVVLSNNVRYRFTRS